MIVGLPDENAWRILLSNLNACLGVKSLVIVGWTRSAIVTAGAVEQRNQGKDAAALESHSLLP